LAASEIIVVGAVFVLGIAMAVAVVKREKRVDLA
jgi:hypothetical protein